LRSAPSHDHNRGQDASPSGTDARKAIVIDTQKLPWTKQLNKKALKNFFVKNLVRDKETGMEVLLVRYPARVVTSLHTHPWCYLGKRRYCTVCHKQAVRDQLLVTGRACSQHTESRMMIKFRSEKRSREDMHHRSDAVVRDPGNGRR
jgi:hypothetical protein